MGLTPSHDDLSGPVVRWLTPVTCTEVVNAKDVTFLPPAVDHVLMDAPADLAHLPERDGRAVPERCVECHVVT